MSEVLFRGKRIDTGEWVYGFYFYDIGHSIKERPSSVSTHTYLVDPNTVGQFVGLRDSSGVRIFEGDVIRWKNWKGEHCESHVIYDSEWNRFCVWLSGAESFGVNKHLSSDIEVIGSIYDKN